MNPSLKDLQALVGTWKMEISNASFLSDLKTVIQASASIEWFEGGDFLILRQGEKGQGTPFATWFIGKDEDSPHYTVLYLDDKQSSRVYEMSFEKSVWKIWRTTPEFTQRFAGEVSADEKTITGYWEKSFDGKESEHDFDIKYSRQP